MPLNYPAYPFHSEHPFSEVVQYSHCPLKLSLTDTVSSNIFHQIFLNDIPLLAVGFSLAVPAKQMVPFRRKIFPVLHS